MQGGLGGEEQRGNQSILGSNLYCPGLRQTQGVGRPYEVSTSCDLDWSGAQESTGTVFFLVNTLLTGQLQRDTIPHLTARRWRGGSGGGSGMEVNRLQEEAK